MEKLITGRPQRNRRHSRRAWPPEDDLHHMRPAKRLFTPDIKRMLKDWLVRRRENPYPSREEKKRLAIDTGLTYTQICNWFANWRRKLKNSEHERARKGSWGHLIKNYNTNAKGNVEQFSISSEDSIWEEDECARCNDLNLNGSKPSEDDTVSDATDTTLVARKYSYYGVAAPKASYFVGQHKASNDSSAMCTLNTPTPTATPPASRQLNAKTLIGTGNTTNTNASEKSSATTFNTAKYKQKMMEKYLRDTHVAQAKVEQQQQQLEQHEHVLQQRDTVASIMTTASTMPVDGCGTELSKWLESAARFTPDKNNYFIEWNAKTGKLERKQRNKQQRRITIIPTHVSLPCPARSQPQQQQSSSHNSPTQLELDAAEALANLAFNCRQRMLDATSTAASMQTINAISS